MKSFAILFVFFLSFVTFSEARLRGTKYDPSKLPFDLRPVRWLVGKWAKFHEHGSVRGLGPPDVWDFGINPIPMFGSRALNITGHYHRHFVQPGDLDQGTIYGFMPVRNATRRSPKVTCAFVTTYSNGFNLIEQGRVDFRQKKIRTHLKQFMKRSWGLEEGDRFSIDEFEREFQLNGGTLNMKIQSQTTSGNDDYTASYWKIQG
jgi:hypothetical protein